MKLKMAEKSLFAILLRSPWWISFALAGVVGMAARLLLPAAYADVGMMGGLPFVVIGCIAFWRQARAPSSTQIDQTVERLAAMNWREFAPLLQAAYQRQGYAVQVSGGAADFELRKDGATTLVSARRWKAANPGVETLRELVVLRDAQDARHATFLTLSNLSASAAKYARDHRVGVPGLTDLTALMGSIGKPQKK